MVRLMVKFLIKHNFEKVAEKISPSLTWLYLMEEVDMANEFKKRIEATK